MELIAALSVAFTALFLVVLVLVLNIYLKQARQRALTAERREIELRTRVVREWEQTLGKYYRLLEDGKDDNEA